MLGFDSHYQNQAEDEALARLAQVEQRILLTRDVGLLKRSIVTHGYWVRSTDARQQLVEIVERFQLKPHVEPFKRCMSCNGLLQTVAKVDIVDRLEPLTRKFYDEFYQCQTCAKIYWRGTHYQNMKKRIEQI